MWKSSFKLSIFNFKIITLIHSKRFKLKRLRKKDNENVCTGKTKTCLIKRYGIHFLTAAMERFLNMNDDFMTYPWVHTVCACKDGY